MIASGQNPHGGIDKATEDAGAERERRPRDAPATGGAQAFIERRWLGDDVGQVDSARLTTMRFAVEPSG